MILYKWVFTTSITIVLKGDILCRQTIAIGVYLNVQIQANRKVERL